MTAPQGAPPQRRPRRRDRGGVALLVCVLLVGLIAVITPDPDEDFRRAYVDVDVGQKAAAREFDATVTGVRLGHALLRTDYDRTDRTNAVWLVAAVTADVRTRTSLFNGIELVTDDGHRYAPRNEQSIAAPGLTMPGFSTRGVVVFELPRPRVPEATLIIGSDGGAFDFYDTAIRVDLGLTDRTTIEKAPIPIGRAVSEVTQ